MTKALKIIGITLGIIILLVFVGIKAILEPMVQEQARSYLENTNSEFYSYSFKTLKLNVFDGTLRIEEVDAVPGVAAFDSLRAGIYDDIDQLFATNIYISINYYAYLRNRKVEISEIRIVDPEISIFYSPDKKERKKDPVSLEAIFNDNFQGVQLDWLHLENASYTLQNIKKENPELKLKSLNINIENVRINPETIHTMPLGFDFEKIELSSGTINVTINEYYDLNISSINAEVNKIIGDTLRPGTNLKISGIHYLPNEYALRQLKNNQLRNLTEISTEEIILQRFKISQFIEEKRINIEELIIQEPAIRMYVNTKLKKSAKKNPSKFVLKKIVEDIQVEKFRVVKGQLVLTDIDKSVSDLNLQEVEISFNDIHISESTQDEALGMTFSSGHIISGKGTSDLGEFYQMETGKIAYDFVSSNVSFNNIKLIPKHSREEFSKITPYEQDQFNILLGSIKLNKLDMHELNENLGLKLQSVEIINANIGVFRDKWVEDQEFVYKPLPSSTIRNMRFPLWIDTLRIKNATITYEQLGDVVKYENEQPGKVTLSNLNAIALRVTNNKKALAKDPELVVNAEAIFMNSRKLTAKYRFVIPDTTDKFYVTARMDSFPTKALDPMIKNILLIEIPDGFIRSMEVDMTGTDDRIIGRINMEYEKLNINILKAKKPEKSSGFLNTIANGVIIKNNTKDKGKFITGIVDTERKQNKSVFNYTWNGIKSGLISTVVPFAKKEKTKNKKRADQKRAE